MRKSNWTPSIVPNGTNQTIYLIADGFGNPGNAWVNTDYETTELETMIKDLLSGQYCNPIRVIAFNPTERWCMDVSEEVALGVRRHCDLQMRDVPSFLQDFIDRHEGLCRDVQPPSPGTPGLS